MCAYFYVYIVLFLRFINLFSAGFTATLPLGFTPVSIGSKVRYNQILLNKGGEYTSGLFTVNTKGLYHVSVSMMSGRVTSHTTLKKEWTNFGMAIH